MSLHNNVYGTYTVLNEVSKKFTTDIVHGCSSGFEQFVDWFEAAAKDVAAVANLICKYWPEVMEGTALAG